LLQHTCTYYNNILFRQTKKEQSCKLALDASQTGSTLSFVFTRFRLSPGNHKSNPLDYNWPCTVIKDHDEQLEKCPIITIIRHAEPTICFIPLKEPLERCNSEPGELKRSALEDFMEGGRRVVEEAEVFVKNVLQASWRIVHHHKLPDWLQDNEYLVFGHRLPLNSFRACFKSVFRIHTETGNIWTHLIG